jgi:hypothetical protein
MFCPAFALGHFLATVIAEDGLSAYRLTGRRDCFSKKALMPGGLGNYKITHHARLTNS